MTANRNSLDFCFRNTHLQSRYSGNFLSRIRANSGDFHELRPYVTGEETSRIDYRKSNFEENELIVREYVQEKSYEACLAYCLDPSWRFGTAELTKFDMLSEATMLICESVWEKELQGSIALVGASVSKAGFLEYPFPRDAQELRHFFDFLKKCLLSCDDGVKEKKCREVFTGIAEKMEQRGIILFGETVTDETVSECFPEYQVLKVSLVHPTELRIARHEKTPQCLLDGPVSTEYGARLILSQPEHMHIALQTAFHLW